MFKHTYEFLCPNCGGTATSESEVEIFEVICPCGAPSKMVSHKGLVENSLQDLPLVPEPEIIDQVSIDTPTE